MSKSRDKEWKKQEKYDLRGMEHGIMVNYGDDISQINEMDEKQLIQVATTLGHLIKSGYSQKFWKKEEILSSIKLGTKDNELIFFNTINNILGD